MRLILPEIGDLVTIHANIFFSMEQVSGSVGDCVSEGLERAEHDFGVM